MGFLSNLQIVNCTFCLLGICVSEVDTRRESGSTQLIYYRKINCGPGPQNQSLGYICSNSQQYIEWVKIIDFYLMAKLSKDHVPEDIL